MTKKHYDIVSFFRYLNNEGTGWASGHFLSGQEFLLGDCEPVSTGAGVVVGLLFRVPLEILQFYFVVKH
jgi:hypothetical protein